MGFLDMFGGSVTQERLLHQTRVERDQAQEGYREFQRLWDKARLERDAAMKLLKEAREGYGKCECDSTPGPLGFEPCLWCRVDQYLKAPE